jgi:hypothetical protein
MTNKITTSILYTILLVAVIIIFVPFDYAKAVSYILLSMTAIFGFLSYSFTNYSNKNFGDIWADMGMMIGSVMFILAPLIWMTTLQFEYLNVFKYGSSIPKMNMMVMFFNMFVLGSTGVFIYFLDKLTIQHKQGIMGISLFSLLLVYMIHQTIHYFITDDIKIQNEEKPFSVAI